MQGCYLDIFHISYVIRNAKKGWAIQQANWATRVTTIVAPAIRRVGRLQPSLDRGPPQRPWLGSRIVQIGGD
jgi:hypothetical protein